MAQPTSYQSVDALGVYDPTGKPHFLLFDGVDDHYTTGNIDFTGTDKMTVVAGVSKQDDLMVRVLIELSAVSNTNDGAFKILSSDASEPNFSSSSRGTAPNVAGQNAMASGYPAPITAVITATHDIAGDISSIRVDRGTAVIASGDKGSGNFGNYPLYICVRGGTDYHYKGNIHALIIRGAATSDPDLLKLEQGIAKLQGRTL